MFKIGTLSLRSKLMLAPMAGISDSAFRLLNREFNAEMAFIEMINCRSVSFNSRKTKQMLFSAPEDRPLGVQILGCEPKYILKALEVINNYNFDLLDFNAACPVKKVVRRGEGASLLKEPRKLSSLLKLIVRNSKWPVTVKMRIGWDSKSRDAVKNARLAEDAGVSAVFIHGRTREQFYTGSVDYSAIRMVKEEVGIPVIASGDLLSPAFIKKMFDETGCDAVTLARGALGNPWIFQATQEFLDTGVLPARPSPWEVAETMKRHLDYLIKLWGEKIGVIKFRKFFSWYSKGFRGVRPLRERSSIAKTSNEMLAIIAALTGGYITKNPQSLGVFCR